MWISLCVRWEILSEFRATFFVELPVDGVGHGGEDVDLALDDVLEGVERLLVLGPGQEAPPVANVEEADEGAAGDQPEAVEDPGPLHP